MYATNPQVNFGELAELVDAPVLGTGHLCGVGSSPILPTSETVDKSVYEVVYDTTTLSTIVKMKGVVYKEKLLGGVLRKNYTFHLNDTCDYYSISSKCFFQNNLNDTCVVFLSTIYRTTVDNTHVFVPN